MASWRASLSAGLTRYLLAGAALCSALYVVGLLGFAGAAHGALSGDPGPFLDTEVRSVTVEEASRMGRSGRGDAGPYLADFFAEVAEAGLRPDAGGPHTYRAGDSLVFYRVVQTGASGVEIRFLDCHEALRLLRAVKLAAVTVLLASFAAFAALGRRLVGAVEGRQALSDEIARRLLHDVKTPLAALLASGEGAAPGAATCPEGALDELAEAFDHLLLLGGPSGGDPCATDAREVVLDAARLVDRDAEGSGGRLAVDAPEPARVVCDGWRVAAVLCCVAKEALAEADGCVRLFARSGTAVTLGVSWEVAAGVPGNETLAPLLERLPAVEACAVEAETAARRRRVSLVYPLSHA